MAEPRNVRTRSGPGTARLSIGSEPGRPARQGLRARRMEERGPGEEILLRFVLEGVRGGRIELRRSFSGVRWQRRDGGTALPADDRGERAVPVIALMLTVRALGHARHGFRSAPRCGHVCRHHRLLHLAGARRRPDRLGQRERHRQQGEKSGEKARTVSHARSVIETATTGKPEPMTQPLPHHPSNRGWRLAAHGGSGGVTRSRTGRYSRP